MLPDGFQFTAELGLISDRNFLEQYFEYEWDELKDQTTGIDLKRYVGNSSWDIMGDVRLNDFFTQTEWLPRFDHFLLGESLLQDRLTWFSHSSVGYGHLQVASPPDPINPEEVATFNLLPWEVDSEGLRALTRQEIDLPFSLGAVKVVPYALGEIGYWGEIIGQEEVTRAYGQAGVRASLPFWRVDPTVQSMLFNLNGLAHKVTLDADFFWADANQNSGGFPAVRSAGRRLDRALSPAVHDLHFRRHRPGPLRGPLLRVAIRYAALGHGAEPGDHRRSVVDTAGCAAALADQTGCAGPGTDRGLDCVGRGGRGFPG